MNNNELKDNILAEIRISELNTHEAMREIIKPVEMRVTRLEKAETVAGTVMACVGAIFGWKWIKGAI